MQPSRFLTGLCLTLSVMTVHAQSPKLSPEGVARRSTHEYLFGDYLEGKDAQFNGTEPKRFLNELVIDQERRELSGEVSIELPAGTERVVSHFRYLVLRGQGLDHLEGLVCQPYAPKSDLSISTRESNVYRVKVPAMPVPTDSMPPITLTTRCKPGHTAVITQIALNSQGKLSTRFNDIPYRNLGSEFPRESVDVRVDITRELSLAGHVDLERDKFFRYYARPGHIDKSFERWAHERHFQPGRQIFKLQPALVKGYSPHKPKLTEDPERPGAADLSFFDRYQSGLSVRNAIEPFRKTKHAMCFNDYPEFMSVKTVGRGTPLEKHFGDAAELAAAYVEDEIRDAGRSATYWEVKNESSIKSEWDYHWDENSWTLLADFHNQVADAIHRRSPETMVGGPTSAWMQLQTGDFDLYRKQVQFMDQTKDHVDFYSHHFYEDFGSLGAWEQRDSKYTNYLLGRMDSILDMFAAHMHATDNVKPILITEFGSLQPGRGPSDYWLRARSYSALMHKMMKRPDQIDLAVPFIFLSIPWNPQSGDTAFIPQDGEPNNAPLDRCNPTPLANWFELWRDFDGRRLPVDSKRKWLDVTAVHQGNRVQLAVTNMGGRRLSLNVLPVMGDLPIESVKQKRMYYRDGEIHYEDQQVLADASAVPVDVEETTLITIELSRPLDIIGMLRQENRYAAATAVKSSEAASNGFEISVPGTDEIENAWLMVGLHREGGLTGGLKGTFNGQPFQVAAKWAAEHNHLFATQRIRVPVEQIQAKNKITIEPVDGLTITSVHMIHQSKSPRE